jgi:GNAT superfamily N-acetyltransferase
MPTPRELAPEDADSLVAVVAACGETGVLSMSDARYVEHVRERGSVLVSGDPGAVQGYAGLLDRDGAAYLTDLFVHPDSRDQGHGRALLAAMWDGRPDRVTSSSQDPRALSGYARFGARPRWPLVYLRLSGGRTPAAPVAADEYATGDAGWHLGLDGLITLSVLAGPGSAATTAVVRQVGDRYRVLRARTPDPRGLPVLVAELSRRAGPGGSVTLVVPGPHPALPDVLALGARVEELDLWCASPGAADLVDPTRELPSPALS